VRFWIATDLLSKVTIPPYESFTFKPAIDAAYLCPAALTGSIPPINENPNLDLPLQHDIKPICMIEGERDQDRVKFCVPFCGVNDFTIVQHEDGTWHFRRGKHTADEERTVIV
jgi:hypothetical protein